MFVFMYYVYYVIMYEYYKLILCILYVLCVMLDFGIMFDQGKGLGTPETVPFRLTRDMIDGRYMMYVYAYIRCLLYKMCTGCV